MKDRVRITKKSSLACDGSVAIRDLSEGSSAMTHASTSKSVSGFSKAPLVLGLALALGGVAAHASTAAAPMIDAAAPPARRSRSRRGSRRTRRARS